MRAWEGVNASIRSIQPPMGLDLAKANVDRIMLEGMRAERPPQFINVLPTYSHSFRVSTRNWRNASKDGVASFNGCTYP